MQPVMLEAPTGGTKHPIGRVVATIYCTGDMLYLWKGLFADSLPCAFVSLSVPQDLKAADLVFKIYISGATVEGSCASKLKTILGAGCFGMGGDETMIHSLAKVLVQVLRATLLPDQDTPLGACVADIPAVLLSLASVSCKSVQEAGPNEGLLYDPVSRIVLPCIPVSTFCHCMHYKLAEPLTVRRVQCSIWQMQAQSGLLR